MTRRFTLLAFSLAFAATVATLALRHIGHYGFAVLWDDALFFERVAYNVLHHGVAAWNVNEGPLFVATSQLFQLIAVAILGLFPVHYSAAVVIFGACSLALCLPVLARASQASTPGLALLFCLLQAPPALLSVTTGMETPTTLLVVSLLVWLSLRHGSAPRCWLWLGLFQVLVALARPDALLLSLPVAFVALRSRGKTRESLWMLGAALAGLVALGVALEAYYGRVVPLSALLKLSPLSTYDADYLRLGREGKLANLTQLFLLLLPLASLLWARRDAINVTLVAAGFCFVAFHGLFTYEIAGYHARFYAPALPLFFTAAVRGLGGGAVKPRGLLLLTLASVPLLIAAGAIGAIENPRGYGPDVVSWFDYGRYFVGVPAAALLLLPKDAVRSSRWGALFVAGATVAQVAPFWPKHLSLTPDSESNARTIQSHRADVGIDVIARCFPQPLTLAHSEIGLPGVLFPESRIIDFTGLANPEIANGHFDFERLCRDERPEFIFRPHWTHRRLNRLLDASPQLASEYVLAPLSRPSSCPLLVRKDLIERYRRCAAGGAK